MQWVYYYPSADSTENFNARHNSHHRNHNSTTVAPQNTMIDYFGAKNIQVNRNFLETLFPKPTDGLPLEPPTIGLNSVKWPDDDEHAARIMSQRVSIEWTPVFAVAILLIITTIIFIVIVYQRWPGMVAGVIAGSLTSISIFLLMFTLKEQRLVYE